MIKQQQIMLEQLRLKQFERTNEDAVVAASVSEERSAEMGSALANWGAGNKDKNLMQPLSQEKIHSYEEMLLKIQVSGCVYVGGFQHMYGAIRYLCS
jgi:hypothetical protein